MRIRKISLDGRYFNIFKCLWESSVKDGEAKMSIILS